MTWTLWRGRQMIGEVLPRHTAFGQPGQVSGVLVPRPGIALPKSGSQHHVAIAGHSWVAEVPTPDLDGPDRLLTFEELEPHPRGAPSGIPPEERLSIRSEGKELVPARAISVHEHRLHPEQPEEEVAALPDGAIVGGSVWLVGFWLQGDAATT